MIIEKSNEMMRKSFEKTTYKFMEIPERRLAGNYGIYVHVPFCHSKCAFCPFYKEIFNEAAKDAYLLALHDEIHKAQISGQVDWVYFGGGTPNVLTTREIKKIVDAIRSKVQIPKMGIELLPALLNKDYLQALREAGFTKISMGIESFSDNVIKQAGRNISGRAHTRSMLESAKELGLLVNVDMMIGLNGQTETSFQQDIATLLSMRPTQITTYPFMRIRGAQGNSAMTNRQQFAQMAEAAHKIQAAGYGRHNIWTFGLDDDIYDTSGDELTCSHVGFGPAAFSTYDTWKVVNTELKGYLRNHRTGKHFALVSEKTKSADDWRKFARAIYGLRLPPSNGAPFYLKLFSFILSAGGYGRNGILTEKGELFSNEITKTVVESLPFPIQNPQIIENYEEYSSYINS